MGNSAADDDTQNAIAQLNVMLGAFTFKASFKLSDSLPTSYKFWELFWCHLYLLYFVKKA